jgi:hypothetical protein
MLLLISSYCHSIGVEGQIQEYYAPLSPFVWKCRVFLLAECYDANVRIIKSPKEKKMNTRKTLVSILMLVSVLLSACASTVTATQAPILTPPTEASTTTSTFSGDPIPEKYLNVDYLTGDGKQLAALRLYLPSDTICQELNTQGNCFTILLPNKPTDPGVRGPAALVEGMIAATFQLCPFCDANEIGGIEYFEPKHSGVLVGVKCELNTGAVCNADVGTTWKPAPQQTTWHSPENSAFHLPMTINYSPGWDTHIVINNVDIIYKGNPAGPQSERWGGGVILTDGARVADPAKIIDPAQMKTPSLDDFLPWPADFFAYVAAIPGMKVIKGPEPITIGGVQGTQIIVRTPAVMHTLLWLKDDWTGLGDDYSNRIEQFILLQVNGELVLLEFRESPEKFDERYLLMQEIFNSITFGK